MKQNLVRRIRTHNCFHVFKIKKSIFEAVKDQIDLHLNIKVDIKEIKEVVKKEITENKTIYIDKNIDSDCLE